jgi:hypothetical protein
MGIAILAVLAGEYAACQYLASVGKASAVEWNSGASGLLSIMTVGIPAARATLWNTRSAPYRPPNTTAKSYEFAERIRVVAKRTLREPSKSAR